MITIGLTGGIATGKNKVAEFLGQDGAYVINADEIAHETYAQNAQGYEKVIQAFVLTFWRQDLRPTP